MGCSDCVTTHFFEGYNLAINCFVFLNRTDCALIVVKASAFKFYVFAVEAEAFVCVPTYVAIAERCVIFVYEFAFFVFDNGFEFIESGCVKSPESGIINLGLKNNRLLFSC